MKIAHFRKNKKCFRALWLDAPPVNTIYRKVKVVLTVAHLDHDRDNFSVSYDRLKHLCQLCHFRYDSENRAKRSKNAKGVFQQATEHHEYVNSNKKIYVYVNSQLSTITVEKKADYEQLSKDE